MPTGFAPTSSGFRAANEHLDVVVEAATGRITRLRNVVTGQDLVAGADRAGPPLALLPQGRLATRMRSAHWRGRADERSPYDLTLSDASIDEDGHLHLSWDASDGVRVRVAMELADDELRLWPRVDVDDGVLPPESLCYPILDVTALDGDDRLLFPLHSGRLFARPLANPAGWAGAYPDGFYGCSMQVSAYFATGIGGFYVATHDPGATHKGFAFRPDGWRVWHDHWDLRRGSSMALDHPVVVAPLTEGTWYEAADRYRAWAILNAPWCANGPRHGWARTRWVHEEVGAVIWCAPASLDWSPWYRDYADAVEAPVQIVPGWDWPAELPPTTDHWFPARFHEANVAAWEGHRVTPYLSDLFVSVRDVEDWEPELVRPYVASTWSDLFSSPAPHADGSPVVLTNVDYYACPTSVRFAELHARRDRTLATEHGADGVCYDISGAFPPPRCVAPHHDHPPGWGRHLFDAYNALNHRTHDEVLAATGAQPAIGTECMNEVVLGSHDFYTARACSGPMSGLEAAIGGPELPPGGGADLVPFFEAVYHDYGPVRQDGWSQLSRLQGDLWFWTSARLALQWGGILSLHYAINWPGAGHGRDDASLVGWDGGIYTSPGPLPEDDPDKLAFLAELGAARTGYGREYLGWGRLLPPPVVDAGTVELRYCLYGEWLTAYRNEGVWRVPRVVTGAWETPSGRVGTFLCNVDAVPVSVTLDPAWGSTVTGRSGVTEAPADLVLEPRTIVLVD